MMKTLITTVTLSCLLSLSAHADNTSYVSLETTTDNANGKDYYIGTGIDFIGASQLNLSYGSNDSGTLTSNNYSIGITSNPLASFSTSFTYLYWEQKNEMETNTFQLGFNNNTDDWGFYFSPELRAITLYPLTAPPVDLNSTGIGISAAYYGSFPLFISAGFKFYTYDRNVKALNTNQYPQFTMRHFSSATLDQASGLEDNRFDFELGYSFSRLNIGYYHESSTSAVDDSTSTSKPVSGKLNLTDNRQLGVETGRSKTSLNSSDTITFTSASITYNW